MLKMAIHLFHQQFQLLIMDGNADQDVLYSVLPSSIHLDPFEAMGSGELGFLWIAEILNSGYGEEQREWMAREVVESLGRLFFREDSVVYTGMEPAWIPPLLEFLSLREKLYGREKPSLTALHILAASQGNADFCAKILPILVLLLLPTHPLQSRRLALTVFCTFRSGWFSSQMENVPSKDLNELIQAVGDPFQSPDFPLQGGKPMGRLYYDPMRVAVVLIKFASLDLWQNHLQPSNFTSLEEIVSTWDGKRDALTSMAFCKPPEGLFTATGIVMAVRRLEELQCSNTAEVVIMWAWTIGIVNLVDHDGWQLIESSTLQFYETHGMECPVALERYITSRTMESSYGLLLRDGHYWKSRVGDFFKLPVLKLELGFRSGYDTFLCLSQACQLKRLHQLFWYDLTMWKDTVTAEEVGEKSDVSLGRSVTLSPSMDWACDYP